jgi:type I restriction enzyme M protein
MSKMRIVALFDLPPNVFADSGVNTTLVVAYKPETKELEKLKKENYSIFTKNIKKVGYEIRTSKRVKFFN